MNNNGIVQLKARAKINLRLVLEGRRSDGYHLLSMLNATVGLCDNIAVRTTPTGEVSIVEIKGASAFLKDELLDPHKNLASKAATAFKNKFDLENGLELSIEKNIPSGAGLGGGSSDAGAVLRFLGNEYESTFQCEEYWRSIHSIATELGADVPFFLGTGFSHVSGIGEKLKNFDPTCISGLPCLLIYPNAHSETKTAFSKLKEKHPKLKSIADEKARSFTPTVANRPELLSLVRNDLEPFIREDFPQVEILLNDLRLEDLLVSGMTGSGTAVFAVPRLQNEASANRLQELCKKYKSQGFSAWITWFEGIG